MRIQKNEIQKMKKTLAKISYKPLSTDQKYRIVFPIETTEVKDYDGIEMFSTGSVKEVNKPEPVLLLNSLESLPVGLAYCNLAYSVKFDITEYCRMLGETVPRGLDEYECLLVPKDNIFASFEI